MRPRRSADDLAWMRTFAGAVAATFGASAGLVQALEGPGWLKAVAAAVAVGSAILALGFHGAERRAVRRERSPGPPITGSRAPGTLPIARASAPRADIDALPDDAVVVFLSYAREDEQWRHKFETVLRPLCDRGVYVWSDERVVVGEALRLESERAIDRAHAALVLVTPDLVACDYIIHEQLPRLVERQIPLVFVHVRATLLDSAGPLGDVQWGHDPHAPIAGTTDPDGAIVRACKRLVELLPAPDWAPAAPVLERAAARSPRRERLDPPDRPGELHDVPPPAPEEVQRIELDALRAALLREGEGSVGITGRRIGLYGQGGIGKTVLAAALARDPELRCYFPDGIYWTTVGERGDLLALQIALLARLQAPPPDPRSIASGAAALREALAERRCLLIVDDVWSAAAAAAFAVTGSRGRVLYTTRDSLVLEAVGADVQRVDVLPDAVARTLLARLSGVSVNALPPTADRVLSATRRVALAVALIGAAIGRGGPTWERAAEALERATETYLDHPYADIFKAMQVAVAALGHELAALYRTLAVYPEDTRIPVEAVARLWARNVGASREHTRQQLRRLAMRELLVLDKDAIVFHELQREFLLLRGGDLRLVHADLLAAYRESSFDGTWSGMAPDEPYIWEHLIEHLRAAGDVAEMRAVATDLAYLAIRCFRNGPYAAESDLRAVGRMHPADPAIDWATRLLARCGHLFTEHSTLVESAAAIAIRAQDPPAPLAIHTLRKLVPGPLLTPRWGLPDTPEAQLRVLQGHTDGVWSVAFSRDGRRLASAGSDASVRLWDASNGAQQLVLEGHRGTVWGTAFSRDGRMLASVGEDATVRLWNAVNGAPQFVLEGHHGAIWDVAFARDGRTLASTGDDGTVRLWDAGSGAALLVLEGHRGGALAIAFARDGRMLASAGSDGTVRLWDAAAGVQQLVLEGHRGAVWGIAFAPGGRLLASAGADATVRLWDTATGAQRSLLAGHDDWVWDVAFSDDGRVLASAGADAITRLWDVASGTQRRVLKGHESGVHAVAFAPQRRVLASAGADASVRLWDPATGTKQLSSDGHNGGVSGVAFSGDGRTLATAGTDATVRLWHAASGAQQRVLHGHDGEVLAVATSLDGRAVVSAGEDATVRLWEAASGAQQLLLEGHHGPVRAVAISADGRAMVSAGEDSTVRLWDAASGAQQLLLDGHHGPVRAVAISADGRMVLSGGTDGTVRLWEAATGEQQCLLVGHGGVVRGVAFSVDGRMLASASADGTLRLWAASNRRLRTGPRGMSRRYSSARVTIDAGILYAVAFSPGGDAIAGIGEAAGSLRLWSTRSGARLYRTRMGTLVSALDWRADGIALGTSSTVVILDILDEVAVNGRRTALSTRRW